MASISVWNGARLLVAAGVALILAVGTLPAAEASSAKSRSQQARPAGKATVAGPAVRQSAGKTKSSQARKAKAGAKPKLRT